MVVSLSSNTEGDKAHMPISVEDGADEASGHVCRAPVEASTDEGTMAALVPHPSWAMLGQVPPPRDGTAFKTGANKGREVT